MELIFLTIFSVTISASGTFSGFPKFNLSYHESIGIPSGRRIKAMEERILAQPSPRIIGGNIAARGAHPYLAGIVASLVDDDSTSICGSTLLSPNRLVTAGHCWYDGNHQAAQFTIVLGSQFLYFGGLRIPTSMVYVHPYFIPALFDNDVAVIALPTNVQYTRFIQPANLPHNMLSESFEGQSVIAAGYGKTSDWQTLIPPDSTVREVRLQVIPLPECQWAYKPGLVKPTHICTGGIGPWGPVGICNGDSGGPLIMHRNSQPILIGITSVYFLAGCALGRPSAFTRVTSYYNFIMQNM